MSALDVLWTWFRSMFSMKYSQLHVKYGGSYTLILMILSTSIAEVERPRGVSISSKYNLQKQSTASSIRISFCLFFPHSFVRKLPVDTSS